MLFFCEQANWPSGFIKGGGFLDQTTDCRLFKNGFGLLSVAASIMKSTWLNFNRTIDTNLQDIEDLRSSHSNACFFPLSASHCQLKSWFTYHLYIAPRRVLKDMQSGWTSVVGVWYQSMPDPGNYRRRTFKYLLYSATCPARKPSFSPKRVWVLDAHADNTRLIPCSTQLVWKWSLEVCDKCWLTLLLNRQFCWSLSTVWLSVI